MRQQYVLSAPGKILVCSYKTKSGQTKNRYKVNPLAKTIKGIWHAPNSKIIDKKEVEEVKDDK